MHRPTPTTNTPLAWVVATILAIALMAGLAAPSATAQDEGGPAVVDPTSCGHFETQEDAQAAFDSGTLPDPENLDSDGDGIACEDAFHTPDGGPVAIDYTTCGHFETQADAQAALDAGNLEHPEFLDGDGDGVACEEAFEPDGGPAVVDPTSCGHFETQEDAQTAFDSGELPNPENLDADGDGIVCEFRWGEGEDDSDASVNTGAAKVAVVALPSTGTGAEADAGTSLLLLMLGAGSCASGAVLRRGWRTA